MVSGFLIREYPSSNTYAECFVLKKGWISRKEVMKQGQLLTQILARSGISGFPLSHVPCRKHNGDSKRIINFAGFSVNCAEALQPVDQYDLRG
jgi:hypothetical protein